jgi:hypothetical protein
MSTQIVSANVEPTFLATLATLTGVQTLQNKNIKSTRETVNYISGYTATGTLAIPAYTPIAYFTTNATGNFVFNVTGLSTLTELAYGESTTICVLVTNGATAYYMTGLQVDGVAVTPKYQNGPAFTSGNANSVDSYSITIMKDYSGSYFFRAFVSQTAFG